MKKTIKEDIKATIDNINDISLLVGFKNVIDSAIESKKNKVQNTVEEAEEIESEFKKLKKIDYKAFEKTKRIIDSLHNKMNENANRSI